MDLTFEESEIAAKVLAETIPQMTEKQVICCWLQVMGYTQEQVAEAMGISHQMVSKHFKRAIEKVKVTAQKGCKGGQNCI